MEDYLKADITRYSENFTTEGDCLFKEFSIIKAGLSFGKDSNSFLIDSNKIKNGDLDVLV